MKDFPVQILIWQLLFGWGLAIQPSLKILTIDRGNGMTKLAKGYKPTEKEKYMSAQQLEYFRQKLLTWRDELIAESQETINNLKEENWREPDLSDRASLETEAGVELRTRNRYLKLIGKIDAALKRIGDKSYGFCEETGDPIGLKRLEARPIATMTIEAQERHEKMEKQYIDEE
jgi:DnaK suppressor protein